MKKDIETLEDIQILVDSFYKKVFKDKIIGSIFKEFMTHSINEHLTTMYKFWESILFYKATYKGNPMQTHLELNQRTHLEQEHFNRWLELWKKTVQSLFSGTKAEEAKQKAESIGQLMIMKIGKMDHKKKS